MEIKPQTKVIFCTFFGFLLVMPNLAYIFKFFNHSISDQPGDWTTFAEYFEGIASPVIALFGTVILGYLSIEVSKQNSNENKKLFILEQKVLAYRKIASHFEILENQISRLKSLALKKDIEEIVSRRGTKKIESVDIDEDIFKIKEVYSTLQNFPIIYGHLFKYDFKGEEYLNLVDKCKNFINYMERKFGNLPEKDFKKTVVLSYGSTYLINYRSFLLKLQNEINIIK